MSKILLVDDDDDFVSAVEAMLKTVGYEVFTATNLLSARDLINKERYDLLVLDVMFPEEPDGGFELAREIHTSHSINNAIPVILLTSINKNYRIKYGPQDIDDTWMPVQEFIEKPVDLDMLLSKISSILSSDRVRVKS